MAAEDDFVHGGCHGSDTSQRINDQKKNKIKRKGKEINNKRLKIKKNEISLELKIYLTLN